MTSKKKFILSVAVIFVLFAFVFISSKKQAPASVEDKQSKAPVNVKVQTAKDSKILTDTISYPAEISADQEITVTAKSSGTITQLPVSLGTKVGSGSLLAKIDDIGTLNAQDGFTSSQVQQSQLSLDQAKKAYELAKQNYEDAKDSDSDTADSLKIQRDIAKIQYESAKISTTSTSDNHFITSPISGTITKTFVSVGDSITLGQPIASISKTNKIKIRFYIEQEKVSQVSNGMDVNVLFNDSKVNAKITNISPVADAATKRFLIEATPTATAGLFAGTIATIELKTTLQANDNSIFLPLSALTVGQNETYVFIANGGRAQKMPVKVNLVNGEIAQIQMPSDPSVQIITEGNKLLNDGADIEINS